MRQLQRRLYQLWQPFRQSFSTFHYCGRAIALVWQTHRGLTLIFAILTIIAGLLPGAIAYVGKLIVDAVVQAAQTGDAIGSDRWVALQYLGVEAVLVAVLSGCRQGIALCQSLLRVQLAQTVNVLILQKALTLSLTQFEDSEFYDKMTRARREASSRPLNMVMRVFGIFRDSLSILTFSGLLLQFSLGAVLVLMLASVPAFMAETYFADQTFRVFRRRAPETREQTYLETLVAREDYAKEVKLYQLGELFVDRYRQIFDRLYQEDRDLTIRRSVWGYVLSLLSSLAFYGAYLWIVLEAIAGRISLGDLTMYLVVFRQGQTTFAGILTSVGGMYEDSLYLSTLYSFLEEETPEEGGQATQGPIPGDGIRFEQVSFAYPGSQTLALTDISLHLKPGQKLAIVGENGSGKTTLIKLLTRLYQPSSGRIVLDGLDLRDWDVVTLQQRIGVIFQDFVPYQFTVGENIGVGDVTAIRDRDRWQEAAAKGTAQAFIDTMPEGYDTRLGRWFRGGRELSGGQWQKIALSRAFMRRQADILVLDEPTSAMDAEAEVKIFDQFRAATQNQIAILISHRFSTVRMADQIIILNQGKLIEQGTHDELLAAGGRYAHLFSLQAAGYR
ncbi:ABC transporter ATP-binding protein [Leptolyngbya sp. CCY15150]|uniref:ABC transporter ATP-binding protein n=1 Tax=Leptolyngbya sp. CCY15150 TaxID=2767772 RepID=UPI00194F26D4|nr:ABC transporter ATP-binding protein [Leptolyngbya sp. CCY15150]